MANPTFLYWTTATGKTGLYFFSFCLLLSTSGASLALSLMTLAFFCQLPYAWPLIRSDRMIWMGLVFLPYLIFRMLAAIIANPAAASAQLDASWAWWSMWAFIIVSWWAANCPKTIYQALGLAFTGFLMRIGYDLVFDVSPGELSLFFQGIRTGLNYSVNAAGLYTATAIWGLILLSPRVFQTKSRLIFREGGILIWMLGMLVMLNFCFITQSLSAMFSLLAVLIIMLPLGAVTSEKSRAVLCSKKGFVSAVCLFAILISTSYFYGHQIIHRTLLESNSLHSLIWRKGADMPNSSLGLRFDMWRLGINKFFERPLTGWGPGTSVINRFARSKDDRDIKHYPHLHNTYLVVLVRFGLVGAFFYLMGTLYYVRSLTLSFQKGLMPNLLIYFFSGAFLLLILSSLVSFHITDVDFRFYWLLLAGLAYSPHFHHRYGDFGASDKFMGKHAAG